VRQPLDNQRLIVNNERTPAFMDRKGLKEEYGANELSGKECKRRPASEAWVENKTSVRLESILVSHLAIHNC